MCTAGSRLYAHRKVFDQVVEGVSGAAERDAARARVSTRRRRWDRLCRASSRTACSATSSQAVSRVRPSLSGGEAPPHDGLFRQADGARQREAGHEGRARGDLRAGARRAALRRVDEVIAQANDTPYGLAASVWSNDLSTVHRIVPKLRAGTVWVNCHDLVDPEHAVWRLQAVRLRARARPRGDRALHGTEDRLHDGLNAVHELAEIRACCDLQLIAASGCGGCARRLRAHWAARFGRHRRSGQGARVTAGEPRAARVDGERDRERRPRAGQLDELRPHLRRAALQPADADQHGATSRSWGSPGTTISTPPRVRRRRRRS